jgi:hypothetical protein
MWFLISLSACLAVSSGSYLENIAEVPYRIGSLITGFLGSQNPSRDFNDVVEDIINRGIVRGHDAHNLIASVQQFMALVPTGSFTRRNSLLNEARDTVSHRILSFFDDPGASEKIDEIGRLHEVMDCLLLAASINSRDTTILENSVLNVLYLFQWISASNLEGSSMSIPHLDLIYAMRISTDLFPSKSVIASVYPSLLLFKDTGLVESYMNCLYEKKGLVNDPFLNFVHKQLTYDKLGEFDDQAKRPSHIAMYDRLFTACNSARGLPEELIPQLYSAVTGSEDFTASRDVVMRTNVERALVSVVLLGYELSTLIPPNDPNLVEYYLWCLTALKIGDLNDLNMQDLIELNRVVYQIREALVKAWVRPIVIEEYLLEGMGQGVDHSSSMLTAVGFNLTSPDGHCKNRFMDDESSVIHCNFAMRILDRSINLIKSTVMIDSDFSRSVMVGMWYMLRVVSSPEFPRIPSCINRAVMTMDAFLIKAQREVAEGSEAISTPTVGVLESFLSEILELSSRV